MPDTTHQTVRLSRGKHSSPDRGACVMELASMLAGEPFSDRLDCVCPVLGSLAADGIRKHTARSHAAVLG